jgi:hypothetical protein
VARQAEAENFGQLELAIAAFGRNQVEKQELPPAMTANQETWCHLNTS